jgi:hypothetical protein
MHRAIRAFLWAQTLLLVVQASPPVIYPVAWQDLIGTECIEGSWTSPARTFTWNQNSPTNCMWACQLMNHQFAAVTNGNTCVCGDFFNVDVDQLVSLSECGIPCSGDSSHPCGGSGTSQVYQANSQVIPFISLSATQQFNPPPSFHVSIPCAQNTPGGIVQTGDVIQLSNNSPSTCINHCLSNFGSTYPIQVRSYMLPKTGILKYITRSQPSMMEITASAVGLRLSVLSLLPATRMSYLLLSLAWPTAVRYVPELRLAIAVGQEGRPFTAQTGIPRGRLSLPSLGHGISRCRAPISTSPEKYLPIQSSQLQH